MILLLVKAYAVLALLALLVGAGVSLILKAGIRLKSALVRYLGIDRYPLRSTHSRRYLP